MANMIEANTNRVDHGKEPEIYMYVHAAYT